MLNNFQREKKLNSQTLQQKTAEYILYLLYLPVDDDDPVF